MKIMATTPRKRRRYQGTSIQTYQHALLSIFTKASESGACPSSSGPRPQEHNDCGGISALRYSRLGPLCDRLDCISRPSTVTVLDQIIELIQTRAASISELSSLLFTDDDDADELPSLCVIVRLLRANCLHVADLCCRYVVRRSVYELECSSACVCRGFHSGVLDIIEYLLDGHCGTGRDAVLREFICIFFNSTSVEFIESSPATRFRLAHLVVKHLHEAWTKHGECTPTLVTWVRQAVIPSRFLEAPDRNKTNLIVRSPTFYEYVPFITLYSSIIVLMICDLSLRSNTDLKLILHISVDCRVVRISNGS